MQTHLLFIPRHSGPKAFTLLELLVSLSIVGILTATAIPIYKKYRAYAFDYRAQSDLRSVALAEEAHYLEFEDYLPCSQASCLKLPGMAAISPGVIINVDASETNFTAAASHPKGSGKTFSWRSETGGLGSSD